MLRIKLLKIKIYFKPFLGCKYVIKSIVLYYNDLQFEMSNNK